MTGIPDGSAGDEFIGPARQSRLYQEIVSRLLGYIRSTGLKPGDRIPTERALADALQVSRGSIRQATVALEVRGVLRVKQGSGTYIVDAGETLDELLSQRARLDEVIEARYVLEIALAERAAERRSGQDLENIESALQLMRNELQRGLNGVDGDAAFHHAVTVAAHNAILAELMHSLRSSVAETRVDSLGQEGRPPVSLSEHEAVFRNIREGNPAGAADAMRLHIDHVRQMVAQANEPASEE